MVVGPDRDSWTPPLLSPSHTDTVSTFLKSPRDEDQGVPSSFVRKIGQNSVERNLRLRPKE